jgi:hypothetical protein
MDVDSAPPPHFLIIGVMKAGTTSLFRWIEAHPDVAETSQKEPNFFIDDANFDGDRPHRDAWAAYQGLWGPRGDRLLTGEASVRYTYPEHAARACARIGLAAPEVRLICVLRDPVERLRSHYRYWAQRGRKQRPLAQVVSEPGNPYVGRSLYAQLLRPYHERFGEQLQVVLFEDLVGEDERAWVSVLEHLGLDRVPRPSSAHNVTDLDRQFTPLAHSIRRRGLLRHVGRLPAPLRRLGRRALVREGPAVRARLAEAERPLPTAVHEVLAEDTAQLVEMLGWAGSPWPRPLA